MSFADVPWDQENQDLHLATGGTGMEIFMYKCYLSIDRNARTENIIPNIEYHHG